MVRIIRLDGTGVVREITGKVPVPANTSTVVWNEKVEALLKGTSREDVVVHVAYLDKGGREYTNNYFLAKQKDMHYKNALIHRDIAVVEGGYEVTLACDVFARGVFLSIEDDIDNFVSDNYVDLLPDKPVKVKVVTGLPLSQFAERLRIVSFSDAVAKSGVETWNR